MTASSLARQQVLQTASRLSEQAEQFNHPGGSFSDIHGRAVAGSPAVQGDRVWTLPEIAQAARVSMRTLFSIRRAGQGPWPPVRGTRTRFHDSVVQRWLRGEFASAHTSQRIRRAG
jgi:hypothetical protein